MAYGAKIIQDNVTVQGNWTATVIQNPHEVECVQYTEMFDYLLAGYSDGGIRVFKDLKCVMELVDQDVQATTMSITAMKHRPVSQNYPITNTLICTYSSGFVKYWNYNFQECTYTLQEKRKTTNVIYHPKLAKFITMGDDKKLYVYDEDSKRQERVLSASDQSNSKDGHQGVVVTACFHPKLSNELISGGMDNTIQFWDTRQPNAVRHIDGVTVTGDGIDFTPKGTEFITYCSQDAPIRLWDYGSGKQIKVIEPDKFKNVLLSAGCTLNKSSFVCGGGEPNLVRIVDINTFHTTAMLSNVEKVSHCFTVGSSKTSSETPKFAFGGGKKIYEVSPK